MNINQLVLEGNKTHYRSNIEPGTKVAIVKKKDQRTNILTYGVVDKLLTSKPRHTRGIKVRLKSGDVGRVQLISIKGKYQAVKKMQSEWLTLK